jgi:hypothetical protein
MAQMIHQKPHPNLIRNRSNKTKARIGKMIWESVKDAPEDTKFIELGSVVNVCRKFKFTTRTLHKYLPGNIHRDIEGGGIKKLVILHEKDIVNARQLIALYDRFKWLHEEEQLPLKYLMEFI